MKRSATRAWFAAAISLLLCVFWHAGAGTAHAEMVEVTNLALYSQQFSGPAWAPYVTTVTEDAAEAPDGTQTADGLYEMSGYNFHLWIQNSPASLVAGERYTFSVYLKKGTTSRDWAYLWGGTFSDAIAYFNLASGTVGSVTGTNAPEATIQPVGGSWYRCSLTYTQPADGANFGIGSLHTTSTPSGFPSKSSGYYTYHFLAWGAQLEPGSTVSPYLATTDQPLTQMVDTGAGSGGDPGPVSDVPEFNDLGLLEVDLDVPSRLDVDDEGNIYLTGTRSGKVVQYDQYGRLVRSYAGFPVSGTGIAVDPKRQGGWGGPEIDGEYYIYVAGHDVVTVVDAGTGAIVGQLGSGTGEFEYVGEIDVDADGWIYVADTGTNYVRVFPPFGTVDDPENEADNPSQFGGPGNSQGKFLSIYALSVDEFTGEIYVVDNKAASDDPPEVQVFKLAEDGSWEWQRSLVGNAHFGADSDNPLGYLGGATFDDAGRVYFLDILFGQMRVLSLPDTFIYNFVETGREPGQIAGPKDVIFEPLTQRLIVVCDAGRVVLLGVNAESTNPDPPVTNQAPSTPVALSPVDNSEVGSTQPLLSFQNASDPDGDVLTYQVRVFSGESLVTESTGIAAGSETTAAPVAVALEENASYTWTVRASDGEATSAWSAAEGFYVNAENEPPTTPLLTAPAGGEVVAGDALLTWAASTDPDPFDTVVGYRLEISADDGFASLASEDQLSGTSVVLGELTDYAALEDGNSYFWRVVAIDNDDVESIPSAAGTFQFDTTVLRVESNVPGARVHVGGNLAYPGAFLGETPLELRDFAAGDTTLVVERSGFEPYVVQIQAAQNENLTVVAELVPAVLPDDLKARPLDAGGLEIQLAGDAAPFLVDFDNDGLIDLLTGEASGALKLFKGALDAEGGFSLQAGSSLDVNPVPGAVPFVTDWNNDGLKDLLVGGADGSVTLFLNIGNDVAPAFDSGAQLLASGVPVAGGSDAAPAVIDIDLDGDKDLVVGSTLGKLVLYRNDGSDSAPLLTSAGSLLSLASPVVPCFVDWDADGTRDLLVAASEHLYRCHPLAGGGYQVVEVLTVGDDLVGKSGKSKNGAYSLGERLRIFPLDYDGKKGKDLVVGNAGGEIRLATSNGVLFAGAFYTGLLDKIEELAQVAEAEGLTALVAADLDAISADLQVQDLKGASKKADDLAKSVDPGTEFAIELTELQVLVD